MGKLLMDIHEAAMEMGYPKETVLELLRSGELVGRKSDDNDDDTWRTTAEDVLAWARSGSVVVAAASGAAGPSGGGAVRGGGSGGIKFPLMTFHPGGPFNHQFPCRKGVDPDTTLEKYNKGFTTTFRLGSRGYTFTVGFGTRWAAGSDRARACWFLGDHYRVIARPLVQFIGGNDYDRDHMMASVIKDRYGKKYVQDTADLPTEYTGMPVADFRSVVHGPYASRGLAVIARKTDYTVMAKHAWIRALHKGLI